MAARIKAGRCPKTVDQALAIIAADIDARLELFPLRFEDSLIVNHAPPDDLELLLDFHLEQQQAWRAHARQNARRIRAALLDPLGWEPVEPRSVRGPLTAGRRD